MSIVPKASFSRKASRRILSSTAAVALIWVSAGAHAQNSYDAGDPVIASGSVTFDRTGTPNTEIYTINSDTAVLDFVPNDIGAGGPINFQFAGTVAQYLGGLGISDFTVLNRILAADPSRAIQLNGAIISRLQASPTTPGGSVWFYSPGGIIVGSTAAIDVGNLLLATGDPTGGSGLITDPNQFTINSVPDAGAAISIQTGAQITASNPGSYIALVAPAIVQSGTVSTNGSAAYVAAEQTTLTFNSGLFNITTTVGSNANNNTPLIHDGTTRFIDDSGQRRAYLVSVAKNDAITMLIEGSGQLGFDMATGVNIDNGVVVLSGGFDVADTAYTNLAGTAPAFGHNIGITSPTNNANIQGQVNPFAASEIRIDALDQAQRFAGDVSLNAGSLASLTTQAGGSIDIVGDLDLSTLVYGARNTDIFGGNIIIDASLGNISIGGNTSLTSLTNANLLSGIDPAGTVHGGIILVIADNGNAINMVGNFDVLVEAKGADQTSVSQTSAGNAVGGQVILAGSAGATLSIGGIANISSIANGGNAQFGNVTAGNATGGAVDISATDGSISFGSDLTVSATGTGGNSNADAGDATGGFASVLTSGTGSITIGGSVSLEATGSGGVGNGGGDGIGGTAQIAALGDSILTINGGAQLLADGQGGAGIASGGNGTGGFADVSATDPVVGGGTINIGNGSSRISAVGRGGRVTGNGGTGGIGTGGFARIFTTDGSITFTDSVEVVASANGGGVLSGTGNGGDAIGGHAQVWAMGPGTIEALGTNQSVSLRVTTTGFGGAGSGAGFSSGSGVGGLSEAYATNGGTVNIGGGLLVTASGFAGDYLFDPANQYADLGGEGAGGTVIILANGGNIIGTSNVAALANGYGGLGVVQGGNGTGGTVNVQARNGLLDFSNGTDTMVLSMSGFGGDAVRETDDAGNVLRGGGDGGDGIGGTILLLAGTNGGGNGLTGILRIGDLRISENAATPLGLAGIGGAGAAGAAGQDGGTGGDAVAGVIRIGTNNGSSQFTAGNITVGNRAIGGAGGDGENGGDGGDAAGRQTAIGTFNEIGANTGGFMTVGNIDINGSALGGNGGAGLNGTGGIGGDSLVGAPELLTNQASAYLIARPNIFTFGDAVLTMNSTGGDGGLGTAGRAAGGSAAGFGAAIITTEAADGIGFGQVVGNSFIAQAISTGGLGAGDISAMSNRGFSLLSAIGGSITLANATLIDGGLAPHQNGLFSAIESGNGFVLVTGLADVDVDGDFGLLGYAGGDVELENLNVVASGTILFDDPNAPGSTTPDAITINQNAIAVLGGDFTIAEDIIIGGVFDLTAAGSINTLGITAGAGITLRSGSMITTGNLLSIGDISITGMSDEIVGLPASIVTGNITSQTGLVNVVTNIGDITLGNLTSSNAITINAGNGSTNTNAGGDIVVGTVQGSDLNITGTHNLAIGNTNVSDSLALNFAGSINTGSLSAGNSIALNAGGTITTTGDATTASFTATSGADLILGGGVTAIQQATLAASGLASFGGLVSAPSIVVISADIAIGTNGGLGGDNTNYLEINAVAPDQPVFFGGNGSGGGYNLSALEAVKLRSQTIQFNALQVSGADPADITVGDFTLQGSLAGSNANLLASELIINSSGNIMVTGAARIENAGMEDSLFLTANGRIEVVTDLGGSITIVDGAGALGGNLYLDAMHIAVGTADLLGRLATDPRFTGRDSEVDAPDGSNRPEGYIAANRIQVDGFDTIIIQNSGTETLRGGFSAGSGGFVLDTTNMATGSVDVVINGRIADGSGGYLTNDDTLHAVSFEDPAQAALFSAGSTVNGCVLNGGSCPGGSPTSPHEPEHPTTIASDVREIMHESEESSEEDEEEEERAAELTPESKGKKSPIAPNVPVVNTQRLTSSPIIADPITGSGNPNFISGDLGTEPSASPGVDGEGGL